MTSTDGVSGTYTHQARNRLPPDAPEQRAAAHDLNQKVLHTRILGGIVNEYGFAA